MSSRNFDKLRSVENISTTTGYCSDPTIGDSFEEVEEEDRLSVSNFYHGSDWFGTVCIIQQTGDGGRISGNQLLTRYFVLDTQSDNHGSRRCRPDIPFLCSMERKYNFSRSSNLAAVL